MLRCGHVHHEWLRRSWMELQLFTSGDGLSSFHCRSRDLPRMTLARHCVLSLSSTCACAPGRRSEKRVTLWPCDSHQHALVRPAGGRKNRSRCDLAICINVRSRARQAVGKTGYAAWGLTIHVNMRLRARSKSEKGVNHLYNSAVLGFMAPCVDT